MKIFHLASALLLTFALSSCSLGGTNNNVSTNTTAETDSKADPSTKASQIDVSTTMTLSNNNLYNYTGKNEYLRLKMTKGKYYEDWNPGAYSGTIWEGNFVLEICDEAGKTLSQLDLSKLYSEQLKFSSSFNIELDDYNNDGEVDFTLGQYTSSNNREYKLFTIHKNNIIEELAIKDTSSLLISQSTGFFSTKLTKVDNITFKVEYYDNSNSKNYESYYKWDTKQFVVIKKQEVTKTTWDNYINNQYHVSFKYPSSWKLKQGYSSERYEGQDGFFHINAVSGEDMSIEEVSKLETEHKQKPYGSNPRTKKLSIQGQEAILITASDDRPKEMNNQSSLIIKYPSPIKIGSSAYNYFVLWADKDHIEEIGNSISFN